MTSQTTDQGFDALLDYLSRARGFDFSAYKKPSLKRRILKRVSDVGCEGFIDYADYLEVHPDEFMQLFNTILINVTYFFRDDAPWQYLREQVVPNILAGKEPHEPVRVWSAGCASGEEAYTLAMILADALGEEQFRNRVKIYATDVDEEALAEARAGAYPAKKVEEMPAGFLDKYFEKSDTRFTFRKDLRRNVIFGRHDLVQDAPISRVDLLTCRNTLMYFNAEAQTRILSHLHFALAESGFLFLGKSEMLLTHGNLFSPVDLKRRVFKKVPHVNLRDRLMIMAQSGNEEGAGQLANQVRIRETSFDSGPLAQLVVDANGFLVLANQQARALFGITHRDQGRPLRDLEVSYKPFELRSLIERAYADRHEVSRKDVEWAFASGDLHFLDINVMPLITRSGALVGAMASFVDVTRFKRLEEDLRRTKHELETAYEELQSTVEELETTNEELQSTNEELETLNEELQSTNEELETMNEEQQSTNEELEAMNEELRSRTDEINLVNGFLESILCSIRVGVIALDSQMRVQMWNAKCEDLWGLRANEVVGQHFLNLDIALELEPLKQPIRAILSGESNHSEIVQKTLNRRGKPIECRIEMVRRNSYADGGSGVILMMEDTNYAGDGRRNNDGAQPGLSSN
ncbi:MAG TPA: CheR family methyltransferase [Blastocatellia bacterium]|jgi:two-component system CheB/CheR fusion protein|nr:CheR family methyltransferase [Blastocatellia bacterium]